MQRVDHACKPNMRKKDLERPKAFDEWVPHITAFAALPNTYMKLSSEIVRDRTSPFGKRVSENGFLGETLGYRRGRRPRRGLVIFAVLSIFGQHRVICCGDWSVCNTSGGGNPAGFNTWVPVMRLSTSQLKSFELFASLSGTTTAKVHKIRLGGSDSRARIGSTAIPRFNDGQGLWNPFTAIGTASDLLWVANLRRGTASMLQDWRPYLA